MALPVALSIEIVRQLFQWPKSWRKEAAIASITTTIVPVYTAMDKACVDGCTLTQAMFAPSAIQWGALITSVVVMWVHLTAKAKSA